MSQEHPLEIGPSQIHSFFRGRFPAGAHPVVALDALTGIDPRRMLVFGAYGQSWRPWVVMSNEAPEVDVASTDGDEIASLADRSQLLVPVTDPGNRDRLTRWVVERRGGNIGLNAPPFLRIGPHRAWMMRSEPPSYLGRTTSYVWLGDPKLRGERREPDDYRFLPELEALVTEGTDLRLLDLRAFAIVCRYEGLRAQGEK